jgi:saccharopine dehydrogenase-like NADP-dependent oxidoreductase
MKKIIVLGCGLVGGPMALDLAKDNRFSVTVADINKVALDKLSQKTGITTIQMDISRIDELKNILKNYDFVVNAVPGFMGFKTLKAVIESGKNVVDISFFPEDMFELDILAREMNVIAISDMGVAPGMSNVLIGYADHLLDKTDKAFIYVGGLPKVRTWPYEYKAVFSPADVIEEYTRPARYIENGKEVIKPALSDPELMDFDHVGTLEAFNSDGLRSLAKTINAPFLIERTLRYPGHIGIMKVLRETGFFNKEKIEIGGAMISPLEFTSKLLFPKWKLNEGEEDITVMKVIIEGQKQNKKLRFTYNLYDTYDPVSKVHSMARTTGYTATMALRMVAEGLYNTTGITAPEFIGKETECVKFLLDGLKDRGVEYQETITEINS